jgi:hypothetical protein
MRPDKTAFLKAAAFLLIAAAAAGLFVRAEEEADPGICEQAAILCWLDPYVRTAGPQTFAFCILGYAYCKKYVEPFL